MRFKIPARDTDRALEINEREVPPHTIDADPHYYKGTVETFYVVSGTAPILVGETRKA